MEKDPSIKRRLPRILGEYAQSDPALFCLPAHKGRGLAFFRDELQKWDVRASWLLGQGDPVSELARRFSLFYRTARSFLLTGGGASALRVMLRALPENERVIIPEGSPDGMLSALTASGLRASQIRMEFDRLKERFHMPTPCQIGEAMDRTGAGVVFLQSPDAFGFCADIPGIAETVHCRNGLLLVDASFGSHFQVSERLPESAAPYADMTCHCLSTGLNALNQAAVIHWNPCRIDPERLCRLVREENPDPSSLILASMDWALHTASGRAWDTHLAFLSQVTDKINAISGLHAICGREWQGAADHDPSRILLDVSGRNLTGHAAKDYLEERYIFAECADRRTVLLVTGTEDDPDWYARLLNALAELPDGAGKKRSSAKRPGQTVKQDE